MFSALGLEPWLNIKTQPIEHLGGDKAISSHAKHDKYGTEEEYKLKMKYFTFVVLFVSGSVSLVNPVKPDATWIHDTQA